MFDGEVAKGYMIKAMEDVGVSKEVIKKVLYAMYAVCDEMTEDEAKQYYIEW